MDGCVFCALVGGSIPARRIYEDPEHVAFFPLKHIEPAHTLLVPRRHHEYVFGMPDADYRALWRTAKQLAPAIKLVSGAARVGILVEGFSVPHVHVHLVPTNKLNDLNPNRERLIADAEADRLAASLRTALSSLDV